MMTSGNYNITWNAYAAASGIYFINFSNGIETINQKIILQK